MASPHSAGGGALYLSAQGGSPEAVEGALKQKVQRPGTTSKDGRVIDRLYVGSF